VGRLMSSVMEVRRDKFGPKWPMSIAPWQVHLCALKIEQPAVRDAAERLYADLRAAGVEVVLDDRGERPGVQFAEADLLGVPIRFIVSERNLAEGRIEYKRRDTGETGTVTLDEAVARAKVWIAAALAEADAEADRLD